MTLIESFADHVSAPIVVLSIAELRRWRNWAGELSQALAICYKAYRRDFSLPEVNFPWENVSETTVRAQ